MTRGSLISTCALVVVAGGLAGCDYTDPYKREGMWRPEGVVNANIAAQVANPDDLLRGSGSSQLYKTPTAAVLKVWAPAGSGGDAGGASGGGAAGVASGGVTTR